MFNFYILSLLSVGAVSHSTKVIFESATTDGCYCNNKITCDGNNNASKLPQSLQNDSFCPLADTLIIENY